MPETKTPEEVRRRHQELSVNEEQTKQVEQLAQHEAFSKLHEETEKNAQPLRAIQPLAQTGGLTSGGAAEEHKRKESSSERKQRESLEKQRRKAAAAKGKADALESGRSQNGPVQQKREQEILSSRLNAIAEEETADRMEAERNGTAEAVEIRKKAASLKAQEARVAAYHSAATQMVPGSKERARLMAKKEAEVLKWDKLKRELKVARMPEGAEKKREADTIARHANFDRLKKLFRKPTRYSHEDAVLHASGGKVLINRGRATMGGTKAMYLFEEQPTQQEGQEQTAPQTWLFKEATDCIGRAKPSGAVVTAAASKLQQRLRGALSIPAECVMDGGRVVGSIQRQVQKVQSGVDLFRWQAQENLTQLPETTMRDLMNEHTLDWVLCNFDTKGENFINQANDHIISFDKEASFNTLLKKEAQHMSYTFKPHSNDTIYNTMFKAYAEGKLDLDLNANLESVRKLEQMSQDELIGMFQSTLDMKYGKASSDRKKAEQLLRDRLAGLREEYCTFYTQLIQERRKNMSRDEAECARLDGMLKDGRFVFRDNRQEPQ